MRIINEHVVREKVQSLMKEMGVSKKKLGEILGSKGDHVNVRINRANRFLSGEKKKLTLQEINKISQFFGRPASWFLFPGNEHFSQEAQPSSSQEISIHIIEKELYALGFSHIYVEVCLEHIRAMLAYQKKNQKK